MNIPQTLNLLIGSRGVYLVDEKGNKLRHY